MKDLIIVHIFVQIRVCYCIVGLLLTARGGFCLYLEVLICTLYLDQAVNLSHTFTRNLPTRTTNTMFSQQGHR